MKIKRESVKEGGLILAAFLLPILIACMVLDVTPATVLQPLLYSGQDDMGVYREAVMIQEGGLAANDRIGAPGGVDFTGYPVQFTHNAETFLLRICLLLVRGNIIGGVNLLYLLLFGLCGASAAFAMRQMGVIRPLALGGGITFGLLPYLFSRGITHIQLTACEFIPIGILLCVWLYRDERFFRFERNAWRYVRNWAGVVFLVLIAQNGLTYYPFFCCFFFLLTALIASLERGDPKILLRAAGMCGVVVLSLAAALTPWIYAALTGNLVESSVIRAPEAAEVYGLKLIQLLLPQNGYGIPFLQNLIERYQITAPLVNENQTAYMGLAASVGLVLLAMILFGKKEKDPVLRLLSKLMLGAFLLGTIGGIGSIISYVITDMLRAYNRISPFIAFLCITALCLMLSRLPWKTMRLRKPAAVLCAGLMCAGVFLQLPEASTYESREALRVQYNSDRAFVESIEESVPAGAMIFQLPYHVFPEGGLVNNMADYALTKGFLFSDTLRWSYGSIRNSQADLWCEQTAALPVDEMTDALREAGFAGIYLDTSAYQNEELAVLRAELEKELGPPEVSDQGDLMFWKL